jgi:hypothetical protein
MLFVEKFAHFSTLIWTVTFVLLGAVPAVGGSIETPLTLTDTRVVDGRITVETDEWKIVFSDKFNGGIHQWYDLTADPSETDNLTTSSSGGFYNTGTLFDYDVYLGIGINVIEFMTTVGTNANPGALTFSILENTPARVRILQQGHPRLNNGQGPAGDIFVELYFVEVTTIWTLYPTGKVGIDFTAVVDPAGQIVDSGPGGTGKGISPVGCCGSETLINATGGANFIEDFTWSGDTIESISGGWGPIHIVDRPNATQLVVEAPLPSGTNLDYVIRRSEIQLETISIHADGDPNVVAQCSDPATSHWQGGSNGDPLWDLDLSDGCGTLFRDNNPASGLPPIAGDVTLAHWARFRNAGSLLTFFEPWEGVTSGFYNDTGFTDISYTQLGKSGIRPFAPHDRQFLAHMGSSSGTLLPMIKSVADALPHGDDYRGPFAEALVGTLTIGPDVASTGFNPRTAAYEIQATSAEAVIRFDASGGSRAGLRYIAPVVMIRDFSVSDETVMVERSTDGGASFSALSPTSYNLTNNADEAELGASIRIFQYLGEIPATATDPNAWAFRFASSASPSPIPSLSPLATAILLCLLGLAGWRRVRT